MSLGAGTILTHLPIELLSLIFSHLSNRDIKSLRLTCTFLKEVARLRLNRVFLSANPTNIRVFYSIANHDTFRKEITEIIYDDARFARFRPNRDLFPGEIDEDSLIDPSEGCPTWFVNVCKENVDQLISRKGQDVERPDHVARAKQLNSQPPLKICWQYYQNLLQQQDEVLYSKRDEETFVFGLKQFPALKRVTITPAAHGWLYSPLYETPMIRAFPSGFNYPIPRGWPMSGDLQMPPFAELWEDMTEKEKEQWRGFRIITRALAQVEHSICELSIDVNQLPTGLNCTIFNSPCEEYNNLVKLLAKPGFRHLDLSLIVGGQEHYGWPAFRNGYIRRALSQAKDLEHFSLWTTLEAEPGASLRSTVPGGGGSMAHFIPLQSVFPVSEWPNLQQFHLSRFIVTQSDLIKLLRDLSSKVQTISLNFLSFFDNGGNYHSLLTKIRERFRWYERDITSRPRLIIGLTPQCPWTGFGIWIEKEVHAFLYENGENPFRPFSSTVSYGTGLVRDSFEDEHERPNVLPFDLAKIGISKPIPEHLLGR